jgi:tetratricopeptide (TPR) repeat protein
MNPSLTLCLAAFLVLPVALSQQSAQHPAPQANPALVHQVQQAAEAAQHGDASKALSLTNTIVEQHPTFEPALKLQGMLLEQAGRTAEASVAYQKALKLAPNDAEILYSLGVSELVNGHYPASITLLTRHLKLKPRDSDALFYLAQALHFNNDNPLALTTIRQALKLDPNNPAIWQKYGEFLFTSGNNQEALQWLQKAKKADPSLNHIDYDLGAAQLKLMDLASASQSLNHAVQLHPNDQNALALLASAELKQGHWQQAKEAYQNFLASKPEDPEALLGLGQCEVALKDNQAAIDTLNNVLRIDPRQLQAHFYLSRAYAALGNSDESQHQAALHQLMMQQATFVRADETEQREAAIQPQIRQRLKARREDEAIKLYQDHFKQASATLADAYTYIGKIYLFSGNTQDGLRCLNHALQLQPTVRGARTYEGLLDLKQGDLDAAEKQFQSELANDPSYQTAIAEMGEVRYREGQWAEAVDYLNRSRTMTPELLYMQADADFHLGNIKDADLTLETAAAYGRDNPHLMQGILDLLKRNGQSQLAEQLSATPRPN